MKEINITKNESNQRIDKFLKKYLSNAPSSFVYKMLRKKRIKLNGKRANPEDILKEGDKLQFYLADETISSFRESAKILNISVNLDIIYEDNNIVLINKPKGMLSHSDGTDESNTVVMQLITYLYNNGDYDPNKEKTFTPAICNRLDRNTSGIIIGAKNYNALQMINEVIRNGDLKKYYKCIVKGNVKTDRELKDYIFKDEIKNRVFISDNKVENSKEIHTVIKVLKNNESFSLLEIDLITGRPHQIRAHLSSIGHPIIGDPKYGDKKINEFFIKKYELNTQFLHAYRIAFNGLSGELSYLNGREFMANMDKKLVKIEKDIFS